MPPALRGAHWWWGISHRPYGDAVAGVVAWITLHVRTDRINHALANVKEYDTPVRGRGSRSGPYGTGQ